MKASTIEWHLARDDHEQLYEFCEKHKINQEVTAPVADYRVESTD